MCLHIHIVRICIYPSIHPSIHPSIYLSIIYIGYTGHVWQGRLKTTAKWLATHLARSHVGQTFSSAFQQLPGYGPGDGTIRGEHDSRLVS